MTPLKHSPLPRLSHKLFPLPTPADLPTPSSMAPSTTFSALNTSTYKKSGFLALPSIPAFLGKDLEDLPLCPQRHISTQKSTGSVLRARRNQPSKCALVTASPALANTNNCRLNKRSRVELSTGAEALASTVYGVPPVPRCSLRKGALGDPVGGRGVRSGRSARLDRVNHLSNRQKWFPTPEIRLPQHSTVSVSNP